MVSDKAVDTASLQSLILSLEEKPESDARASFKNLLNEAAQPRHVSGNACIKLCYFLEQCRKSNSLNLLNLAYSRETLQDLSDFYVEWAEKNQHRSMRQVLEMLALLISKNPHDGVKNDFRVKSLDRLVGIVRHQAAQPLVKPAFKVLDYFLSKRTINIDELVAAYQRSAKLPQNSGTDATAQALGQFVTDAFEWMALPDTASSAGKLIVCLFTAIKKASTELAESKSASWQTLIQDGLAKYPESLDHVKNYIFLDLFKIDKVESLKFLKSLSEDSEGSEKKPKVNASLLLSAMEVGKKLGLVDEPEIIPPKKVPAKKRDFVVLPSTLIGNYLVDTTTTVRSSAFTILVSSLSSIKPYPTESLDAIKSNLAYLHADTDAKFRNELFTNTKYMLERLKGAIALLNKEIALLPEDAVKTEDVEMKDIDVKAESDEESGSDSEKPKKPKKPLTLKESLTKHLEEHKEFLRWYFEFLAYELIPTASYQRHVTALKALDIALKTGLQECPPSITTPTSGPDSTWKETIVFTPILIRLLLDLLLDPFEEVRNCSATVLRYAPKDCFGEPVTAEYDCGTTPRFLSELAGKARDASAKTGRADFADGLAHTYVLQFKFFEANSDRENFFSGLLDKLEADIKTASTDLETAASKAPVHGQFATIRQLWELMSAKDGPELETLQKLQRRLAACCVKTWETVKEILTNDSPEGHVPATSTETGDVDIKGILSYSFRACHESSLLVQSIIRKLNIRLADGKTFLPVSSFAELGNLTFEQLSRLRHRGAFSTVALTFTQCCRATQNEVIMEDGGSRLLNSWYCGALACIEEQHSTTRRSAGIPALITGVLSASSKDLTFDSIMQTLMAMARVPVVESGKDEVQLSQVHAMNSLKDIFKSATLSRKADSYITDCFQIAADSMKSNVWAISNCGLLLVKSLIDCMLGTSESKAATEAGWDGRSIRISYDRYPQLPDLLLRLLNSTDAKEIFPALEFLRRVGPPEGRNELREQFFAGVVIHLDSKTWDVRDLAARTAATFLLQDDWFEVASYLLDFYATPNNRGTNGIHGTLALIRSLMQKRCDLGVPTNLEQLTKLLEKSKMAFYDTPTDKIIQATLGEALAAIDALYLKQSPEEDVPPSNEVLGNVSPLQFVEGAHLSEQDGESKRISLITGQTLAAKVSTANVMQALLYRAKKNQSELKPLAELQFDHSCDEDLVVAALDLFQDTKLQGSNAFGALMFQSRLFEDKWASRVQTAAYMNIATILHQLDLKSLSKEEVDDLRETYNKPHILNFSTEHEVRSDDKSVSVVNGPELTNAILYAKGALLRLLVFNSEGIILKGPDKRIKQLGTEIAWAVENDDADFYAREAAILAADAFFSFPTSQERSLESDARCYIEMAVLTALSDDDEEIRELAAKVVAKITGEDVIPEAAVPILCKWMQDRYTKQDGPDPQYEPHPDWHRRFYDAFVSGLRNPRTRRPVKPTKERLGEPLVEEEMAEAMKEDNALFVEESQNLYIDEVQEIRKWLSFLTNDKDFALIIPMHEVMEGTQSNLRKFRKYVHQYDGPFGWSSKPEVFGILMKVILAAQTFNRYTRKWDPELDYQDSWGDLEGDCVVAAHMLWAIGKKNALHPLIMAELKKVYPIKCPTVGYCERCENGMPDKELKKREDEVREDGEGFSGESEDEDEEDHFGRGGGTDEEESEDETEVKAESEDSEGGGVAV